MGNGSTRKTRGVRARLTAANAFSDVEKNSSLSDSMFIPYATDEVKDAARLPGEMTCGEPEATQGLSRTDVQMCMLQEALGRFRQLMEEGVYRSMDLVVKLIHG